VESEAASGHLVWAAMAAAEALLKGVSEFYLPAAALAQEPAAAGCCQQQPSAGRWYQATAHRLWPELCSYYLTPADRSAE